MKILITGGAGFIGSNFCHFFYNEEDEFVENRKTNDRRYSMNFDKISAELGYAPKSNFEEKLKETIEWYKEKLEV